MRTTFIKVLEELAKKDRDVFLLTADLGFKLFDGFRAKFPENFFNMGVAEPNMIGVAAGLALAGKKVYCYSMIPFLIMRTLDQIRVDICYHQAGVKLIGVGGGLTYGREGMTHHAIEDLAVMRALPGMTVIAPGDPLEAEAAVRASLDYPGPLYIRLGGNNDPRVHEGRFDFQIGRGIVIRQGRDLTVLAAGTMLKTAQSAVNRLLALGLEAGLISLPTIKPLDEALILDQAALCRAVFTIEEHSRIGGLGSAVAEVLAEAGWAGLFRRIGLPDRYGGVVGRADYLREKSGLSEEQVFKFIKDEWDKRYG